MNLESVPTFLKVPATQVDGMASLFFHANPSRPLRDSRRIVLKGHLFGRSATPENPADRFLYDSPTFDFPETCSRTIGEHLGKFFANLRGIEGAKDCVREVKVQIFGFPTLSFGKQFLHLFFEVQTPQVPNVPRTSILVGPLQSLETRTGVQDTIQEIVSIFLILETNFGIEREYFLADEPLSYNQLATLQAKMDTNRTIGRRLEVVR